MLHFTFVFTLPLSLHCSIEFKIISVLCANVNCSAFTCLIASSIQCFKSEDFSLTLDSINSFHILGLRLPLYSRLLLPCPQRLVIQPWGYLPYRLVKKYLRNVSYLSPSLCPRCLACLLFSCFSPFLVSFAVCLLVWILECWINSSLSVC